MRHIWTEIIFNRSNFFNDREYADQCMYKSSHTQFPVIIHICTNLSSDLAVEEMAWMDNYIP